MLKKGTQSFASLQVRFGYSPLLQARRLQHVDLVVMEDNTQPSAPVALNCSAALGTKQYVTTDALGISSTDNTEQCCLYTQQWFSLAPSSACPS